MHRSQSPHYRVPVVETKSRCPVCGTPTRRPDKHRDYAPGSTRWSWCYGPRE